MITKIEDKEMKEYICMEILEACRRGMCDGSEEEIS